MEKKRERKKCNINFIRLKRGGDCRKCEDIGQGEHKKRYAERIFRTRVLLDQGKKKKEERKTALREGYMSKGELGN